MVHRPAFPIRIDPKVVTFADYGFTKADYDERKNFYSTAVLNEWIANPWPNHLISDYAGLQINLLDSYNDMFVSQRDPFPHLANYNLRLHFRNVISIFHGRL